ncbi:MAG: DUF3748 domain-containing protein [Phycisphaerae bacterium]|jgi:hypothetical protein|nr:DUF3748 domain-containing protein [Phycisphaerae bacterium]
MESSTESNAVDSTVLSRRTPGVLAICMSAMLIGGCFSRSVDPTLGGIEEQLTFDYKGHYLNRTQCFSPDDKWIVYDTRIDPDKIGSTGTIEKVNVETGAMVVMYKAPNQMQHGPGVGAVAYNPVKNRILFVRGLLNCNFLRPHGYRRRVGVMVDDSEPLKAIGADARDVTEPFTPGALRGGTSGHTWSADGEWISFTYQDAILGQLEKSGRKRLDLRTVGVSAPLGRVKVDRDAEGENNDGAMFSVLAVRVGANPKPDSDGIERAYNHSWVGVNGYLRPDGTRQKRAIAFQGIVVDKASEGKSEVFAERVSEVFIVDLPDRIDVPGPHGPLEGTSTTRPMPPRGTIQRRLTFNTKRKRPGIQGPRHWLRSSPDGRWIAYLAKDDSGVAQIHLVSPNGGKGVQLTRNEWPVASSFNWSPDGRYIAYAMDNSIFVTDTREGKTFGRSIRMTKRSGDQSRPDEIGIAWSNRGDKIAFCRRIKHAGIRYPQIFILTLGRK